MASVNHIKRSDGDETSQQVIEDTFNVNVDAANDSATAKALAAAIAPPVGYVISSVRATHINRNPFWYEVAVTYTKTVAGGGVGNDDPLARPSVLSASYEEWTEPYDEDFTAPTPLTVQNSAGDPFQNLPQRKNGTPILQITKNFATMNLVALDAIKFTTNSGLVTIKGAGFAADTLLFLPPTAQEVWEQVGSTTHNYFTLNFRLAADAGKHLQKVADRGFRQVSAGDLLPILDGNGNPTEDPWPLNGLGGAKAAGAKPETLTFKPYNSASWGINFD